MIIAGASAYPRIIDFDAIPRDRRRGRRACSWSTWPTSPASSPPGCTPAPCPTPTSSRPRRTRPCAGPAAGMILCKEEYAKAIDKAVFPGIQGGPLMHVIAAKAVALQRGACARRSKTYQQQVVANAKALAEALIGPGLPHRLRRHRQPPDAGRRDAAPG